MNKKIDDFFDGLYGIVFWIFLFLGIFKNNLFFIPSIVIFIFILIRCRKFRKNN